MQLDLGQSTNESKLLQSAHGLSFVSHKKEPAKHEIENLLMAAHVLTTHRDYENALNLLRKILSINSWHPLALSLIADILETKGDWHLALKHRQAAAQAEQQIHFVLKLANSYYKLEYFEQALQTYFESLALITEECLELFEVYKNIGNIYVQQKDFEGAEEYYNKAYRLNPLSDVLLVNMGTLEIQKSNWNLALEAFRKAVSFNSKNDKAWVGLSLLHDQFGDYELAWANINQALDINAYNKTAIKLMIQFYKKYNLSENITYALIKYLEKNNNDEEVSLFLIESLYKNCFFDWAKRECEKLVYLNPNNKKYYELYKQVSL